LMEQGQLSLQPFLSDDCSATQQLGEVGSVATSDISDATLARGNDISELLAPSRFVKKRFIKTVLARIGVHPPRLCATPYFGPDVISFVMRCAGDESK
jgi:hypothetical protein